MQQRDAKSPPQALCFSSGRQLPVRLALYAAISTLLHGHWISCGLILIRAYHYITYVLFFHYFDRSSSLIGGINCFFRLTMPGSIAEWSFTSTWKASATSSSEPFPSNSSNVLWS